MASDQNAQPFGAPPADERWELLNRVAASPAFEKSNRLRAFLLFVGERALRDPQCSIREQEIGVEVFGRPADYSTTEDNLVRVNASQLRKKLQQYFEQEGRGEHLLIELPRGSYVPVFSSRQEPQRAMPSIAGQKPLIAACVVALLFAAAGAVLWVHSSRLQERAQLGLGPKPAVDSLWRQMFANGRPTDLVLSDGNLIVFEDEIHQQVTVNDYSDRSFRELADTRIADPAHRTLPLSILARRYTSTSDAAVAVRIALVAATNQVPVDVVMARDLTSADLSVHNMILLGSRRANPWVGVFEDKLNFRTVFEEEPRSVYIVNQAPRAQEEPVYRCRWGSLGYCRVAYLPNEKKTGTMLLISGSDIQLTEAGGEFITTEKWINALRESLKLTPNEPMPYFEVLLRGILVDLKVVRFELVASRRR